MPSTTAETNSSTSQEQQQQQVHSVLSRRQSIAVAAYVLLMVVLYEFAFVGVAGVPIQYILKDTFRLRPEQQSVFFFLTDSPLFVAFVFGFLRDRWQPFRLGDRGYLLLLPPLICASNLVIALTPFTYASLLAFIIMGAAFTVWLSAAVQGLMAVIAKHHGMAGRFSVLILTASSLVNMLASFVGGRLAAPAHQHQAFLLSAVLCFPIMALAVWKPFIALTETEEPSVRTLPEGALAALKRLSRHPDVLLPAVILFLWDFAPGWGTPLFLYVTNTIKLSSATYGECLTVRFVGTLLSLLGYSLLCSRFRLRPLLWWGTFVGVLGCPIFLLIHAPWQAYPVFFLAGLSLGIGRSAYFDLLIRCCPKELEGVALLVTTAALTIGSDTSDIFGSWLYEKGGFNLALVVSTLGTAMILAVLPFIPKRLTAPPEGVPLEDRDGELRFASATAA